MYNYITVFITKTNKFVFLIILLKGLKAPVSDVIIF